MKKKIILIYILLFLSPLLFSQTDQLNHEKYWYYRYRFKHYFTSVGPDLYQSLVSARRNTSWGHKIYYGDQTLDMGWYMGALAVEYYMLNNNNNYNEISQTLTELYYLYKAFERLDRNEGKPPFSDYPELRDGFFLRKDAEMLDGINEQPVIDQMNYKLSSEDVYGTKPPGHPTFANNLEHGDGDGYHMLHMSQDHLIHLLLGFSMMERSFRSNQGIISFYNYVTGSTEEYNFYFETIKNVNLIVQYDRNQNHEHGPLRWTIYTPEGIRVHRGSDSRLYCYGIAKAASQITGGDFSNAETDYNFALWQTYTDYNTDESNTNMECILGTIGKSWIPKATDFYLKDKSRYIRQGYDLANLNWDYFYIPFYRFIHIKDSPYQRTPEIENELNNAPLCGPYRYSDDPDSDIYYDYCQCLIPSNSGPGWAHHNRFRRNEDEADGYLGENGEKGNFPGLDYMILFNLYRALEGGVAYRNMLNSYLITDYPYQQNGTWYGTESNPANLRAFESFECNNEIETNANGDGSLNLVASNSIKLTPGFHVYQGAHFSAKVEEYNCWEAGGNGNNKSSYFHDNGYVYNYNPDPMEVIDDEMLEQSDLQYKNEIVESTLLVFPNPAKNQIQFQFENANISSYPLFIRDVYGNTIITVPNYQTGAVLNISTLSNGIYIAEVVIDGRVYQEKFVVL